MDFFRSRAHLTLAGLAAERGVFPAYRGSRLQAQNQRHRNATVTTIASTGHISLIAGRSPGIEPLYGVQEVRRILYGVVHTSLHSAFARRAPILGLNLDSLRPGLATHSSIQHLTQIPEKLRRLFVTAHDVSPEHHVRMHAVFLQYSDSAVSKPSICRPRRPKPRWPQPFCWHTNSHAKASPSFVQAAGTDESFPAALRIPVEPRLWTHHSSTKLTPLSDGDRYFHRLAQIGSNRSVGRCAMAALVGNLTSVWSPSDWTVLFARQPEPDLEFTEEELDQTTSTKARGPMTPRKKSGGGSPILWILLLALVGGITYVSMEPEMLTEWLSPYLGESTPPPMSMKPKPSVPAPVAPRAPAPQVAPGTSNEAPAPLPPATAPAPAVAPTAPAVVPPTQAAAKPSAPVVPPRDPMFSEGQKVTVTTDEMAPGGSIPLFADSSSSKSGPIVRPGISLTVLDGDLQPGGWMYLVGTDEGLKGWVSEKRLRLKF